MVNQNDEDIEIIYWGEDEENNQVDSENFKEKSQSNNQFNWKKEIFSWIKLVVAAVIIALIINNFIIINASVPTGSMKNTIKEHSRMIGFRLSYMFSDPKRGDIVVFKFPDDESQNYVKRIIGLPGEYIEVKGGIVYINDKPLKEDYVYFEGGSADPRGDFAKTLVPKNCYFVMGDNRNNSKDSRFWETTNFVKEKKILGKAIFSYYPKISLLD